jgi:hypothetical protein
MSTTPSGMPSGTGVPAAFALSTQAIFRGTVVVLRLLIACVFPDGGPSTAPSRSPHWSPSPVHHGPFLMSGLESELKSPYTGAVVSGGLR